MIEFPKTQIKVSFKQIKTAPLDYINVLQEQVVWEVLPLSEEIAFDKESIEKNDGIIKFMKDQEDLGEELDKILQDNLEDLYED